MTTEYPLKQIYDVKKRREEEAEKVVKEKKAIVANEEEKLVQVKNARDQVKNHYQDKLTQLRQVLDEGTTSDTIRQMKDYLKVVKEKLAKEEIKVKEQQKKVDAAVKELETAQKIHREKRKEVEKLEIHREAWQKETNKEAARKEEHELDEIGTAIYYGKKRNSE